MKKPFFSIITATYNSETFIKDNLDSVDSQQFQNYEHLIVDGMSTDDTKKLIKSAKNSMRRVISRKPQGISSAFNEGIKEAKGEYLIFLNSDDCFYDKHVLTKIFSILNDDKSLDWIYGKIQVIDKRGKPIGIFPSFELFKTANSFLLQFFNFIPHQAVIIRSEIQKKYLYENQYKTFMDYSLWLKIRNTSSWSYANVIIAKYRLHEKSQSSSKKKLYKNYLELCMLLYKSAGIWFFLALFTHTLSYVVGFFRSRMFR